MSLNQSIATSETQGRRRPRAGEAMPLRRADGWQEFVSLGYIFYFITSLTVAAGLVLGTGFVDLCRRHPSAHEAGVVERCAVWDGEWYARILNDGYSYDEKRASSVAFFPAYPWLSRVVAKLSGLRAEEALLIVAHGFLVGAFMLLAAYLQVRRPQTDYRHASYVLLVFGLFPTTLYFRMAYTESMSVFLSILALYSIERRCAPVWTALVIGLATATRPVGVALLVPFAMHLWDSRGGDCATRGIDAAPAMFHQARLAAFCARCMVLVPLGCWGILAYVGYQWRTFDEPLAFLKTQAHWGRPLAHVSLWERAIRLLTLAPIRAVYDSVSPCYWGLYPPRRNPLFNMMFANPIYFLMTAACVALGAWKRWLNAKEVALSAVLLLIPYVTQSDRMCMASMARFASVAFPVYIVAGNILTRLPGPIVGMLAALSAVMLALYTAMFVNWYWFY